LPRTSSNFETVAVELKRRSQYQYAFLTSNVRPACIREVGTYLVEHGDLFQLQNITFNHSELETIEPDTLLTVSDASDNGAVTDDTVTTNVSTSVSSDSLAAIDVAPGSDPWVEIADMHIDRADVFDTLFSSPDFVEDSGRAAVYGKIDTGHFDHVHTFAPAEGNKPISVVCLLTNIPRNYHSQTFSGEVHVPTLIQLTFITVTLSRPSFGAVIDVVSHVLTTYFTSLKMSDASCNRKSQRSSTQT